MCGRAPTAAWERDESSGEGDCIQVTGPERTLVEGFRRPALVGGLEELVQSAAGLPVLDLNLIEAILEGMKLQ